MTKKFLVFMVAVFSLITLNACEPGENQVWEMREYTGVPYTEERTAGRGIQWVLAMMAPKKGPILEPIMQNIQKISPQIQLPPEPRPQIKHATPIFSKQVKEK